MLDLRGQSRNVNVKKRYSPSEKETLKNVNVRTASGQKAKYLVEKFERSGCSDAEGSYYFFVKCFRNLSEDTIWSIYEVATTNPKINSPIRYFIGACRNQMTARG